MGGMKGFRRWVFNLAAAGSLVVAIGVAVLWGRSYWVLDTVTLYSDVRQSGPATTSTQYWAVSTMGSCVLSYLPNRPMPAIERRLEYTGKPQSIDPPHTQTVSIHGLTAFQYFNGPGGIDIQAPHWAVILLSFVLPGLWYWRRRRDRLRQRTGLCPGCGYDLRASPERCPECGRDVSKSPGQTAAATDAPHSGH